MGRITDRLFGRSTQLAQQSTPLMPATTFEVASPFSEQSHLQTIVMSELFGQDVVDNLPLGRNEAMTVPAVAKGRNILCSTGGRFPILAHDKNGSRPGTEFPFLQQLEAGRPLFITLTWVIDALVFYGMAWLVVTDRYADTARPRYFEWVPQWAGRFDSSGNLVGHTDGRTFQSRDVVRVDGPHEGVLKFGGSAIRAAIRLQRAALRVADNPVPAIELHQTTKDPLEKEEIEALVNGWIEARKRHGVGYTSNSVEAKVHGLNPEQLLIEGRKIAALDCARVMGVPAWAVDEAVEGSSLTYSNTPSRSRELLDYGLTQYLAAVEARLSMDDVLPHGVWARFDFSDLLRADFKERMEGYKAALDLGLYDIDELRSMERGTPRESA